MPCTECNRGLVGGQVCGNCNGTMFVEEGKKVEKKEVKKKK